MFKKIVITFLITQQALAGNGAPTQEDPNADENAKTAAEANAAGASAAAPIVQYQAPSVNQSANGAAKNNMMGAAVGLAVGGALIVKTTTFKTMCSGGKMTACALVVPTALMALQALNQSKANKSAAKQNLQSAAASDGYGYAKDGYDVDKEVEKIVGKKYDLTPYKQAMSQLTSANGLDGLRVDKDGNLVDAKGKKYDPNGLTSAGAMAGAGLSSSAISEALKDANDLTKSVQKNLGAFTPSTGFEDGGGAGKNAGVVTAEESYGPSGLPAAAVTRDPAASPFAGLSKTYNGESIGVAQDNLFNMMTRRYRLKEKQESFYDSVPTAGH